MRNILTLNGGSSSIRFAIFEAGKPLKRLLHGKMERIGNADASLSFSCEGDAAPRIAAAGGSLLEWLESQPLFATVPGIGHRVVHGMLRRTPELVTAELLEDLKKIVPFDPEHLPRELELIQSLQRRFPKLPQVVCFDTAFHRSMPQVASQLPIPRRYAARGIQRYGFHGLSYTYLMQELVRLGDPAAERGRVILAHLGSGASLAAVRNGSSIDTSMGFTPAAGLVMGTRSGDLDPGLMSYLVATDGMSAAQFQTLVNHESGLLGVSETSADVRDLLAREAEDARAAQAIALFCYQAKKWIGAFAAALGGVDTLVFTGGVGENAAPVRERICAGLEFLGIEIDGEANRRHAPRISTENGAVTVRIIRTDEESVIAGLTMALLNFTAEEG
jgi:acetate kinase